MTKEEVLAEIQKAMDQIETKETAAKVFSMLARLKNKISESKL